MIFCKDIIAIKIIHPPEAVKILKEWIMENLNNPYPKKQVKMELVEKTGLDIKKVNDWFKGTRRTVWYRRKIIEQYSTQELYSGEIPKYVKKLLTDKKKNIL